jgi:hypothetical protein
MFRTLILAISTALLADPTPAQTGKREYEARDVGCHGDDGLGGCHGPAIGVSHDRVQLRKRK